MSLAVLINDAFDTDPVAFLAWAYGRPAVMMYLEFLLSQRPGQAFMNTLRNFDQESYIRLTGSSADPFFVDSKIPAAIDKITSK